MKNLSKIFIAIFLIFSPIVTFSEPASLTKNYKNKFEILQPTAPKSVVKKQSETLAEPQFQTQKTPTISALQNSIPKAKPASMIIKEKPVIVIDAGHGGQDPGALGKNGTREKDITLRYATELKRALENTGKFRVVLTRTEDVFVPLNARVARARRAKGDILISLHADSHPNSETKGFSVYTLSEERGEREVKKLIEKSDQEKVIGDVDLKGQDNDVKAAIIDLAKNETKNFSESFSFILARNLGKTVQPLQNTRREAGFAVLTGLDVPSVLIELGYLSNEEEEELLKSKQHREKIVNAIKDAIDEYFIRYKYMI
jgi:N-acetylmuramoyl-L-alanine amidase